MKRDLKVSAQAFQAEGKVSSDPVGELDRSKDVWFLCFCFVCFINLDFFFFVMMEWISAIDAPGGFLFEWWSVFWDIFIARTNEKHSEVAASYIEVGWKICVFISSLFCTSSMLIVRWLCYIEVSWKICVFSSYFVYLVCWLWVRWLCYKFGKYNAVLDKEVG